MELDSAKKLLRDAWQGCLLKFIGMHMLVHGSLASATLSAISLELFVPAVILGAIIPMAAIVTKREYTRLSQLRESYGNLLLEADSHDALTEARVHECCEWMRNSV